MTLQMKSKFIILTFGFYDWLLYRYSWKKTLIRKTTETNIKECLKCTINFSDSNIAPKCIGKFIYKRKVSNLRKEKYIVVGPPQSYGKSIAFMKRYIIGH